MAENAFGGKLNIKDAMNAFTYIDLMASTSTKELTGIIDSDLRNITQMNQKLNLLLITYGLSLINEFDELFDFCVRRLGNNIGDYPKDYGEAAHRTDAVLRQLLEFILTASVTC